MPRKPGVGLTTLKKNIVRESHPYFVRQKTHRFIQRLAEQDERTVGTFLDVLIEQVARLRLPAQEVEQIIEEAAREEERRRQEAEAQRDELLRKRQERKAGEHA